mgnify:CR=1 FL=1|jgi:hypothetical protein
MCKIELPKKPKGSTHIYFETKNRGRLCKALVPIKDIDTLLGSVGEIWYAIAKKGRILQKFEPSYAWDGKKVEGLENNGKKKGKQKLQVQKR